MHDLSQRLSLIAQLIYADKTPEFMTVNVSEDGIELHKFSPTLPRLYEHKLSSVEYVQIPSHGAEMPCFITVPRNASKEKYPLLVKIHGGPRDHDEFRLGLPAQYIASHGIYVLEVNYPGANGFSKKHEKFSDGNFDNIHPYIKGAIENYNIDSRCIAVGGGSCDAILSMYLIAHYPQEISVAIAINGMYNYLNLPYEITTEKSTFNGQFA